MTELSAQTFFGGGAEVDPDDLGKVEVNNFSTAVDQALVESFGWDGRAIGAVGLTLSADNTKVSGGIFITRGTTGLSEYSASCDDIWMAAPKNIAIAIKVPSLDPFTFSHGGLWSDLIPSEKFTHAFYNTTAGSSRTAILGRPDNDSIRDFCLRLVCQISGTSSGRKGVIMKYKILLFPVGVEELSNTPEANFAGWPGLTVADGYLLMGPRPTRKWQCPILPVIRPGTPFTENSEAPSSVSLRFAIASVMGKVLQPITATNPSTLAAKWAKIRANPRELVEKAPATCWPTVPPFQEEQGKFIIVYSTK